MNPVQFLYDIIGVTVPQANSVAEILGLIDEHDDYFELRNKVFGVFFYVEATMRDWEKIIARLALNHQDHVSFKLSLLPYPYDLASWTKSLLSSPIHANDFQRAFWGSLVERYKVAATPPNALLAGIFSDKESIIKGTVDEIRDARTLHLLRAEDIKKLYDTLFPKANLGYYEPVPSFGGGLDNEDTSLADMLLKGMRLLREIEEEGEK